MTSRILVVEDDATWRNTFRAILSQEPISSEVETAGDRQEANSLLEKSNFTLVLLDLCLEGDSPSPADQLFWESLKRDYPQLPVIAITGWPADRNKVFKLAKSKALPFVDFVYKGSFDLEKFRQGIQNILSENSPTSTPQSSPHPNRIQLLEWLNEYFDEPELRTLCFELNIEYDNFPDQGKESKARELVRYCKRHDLLEELREKIILKRPFLD